MLKINDHVLIKNELRSKKEHHEYIILGSKDKPYQCHLDTIHDYYVYPPGDNDYVLGNCSIHEHNINELIFVNESDIVPNIKSL